ncbi:MAG: peptidyl-prolyl cis-trans isomerase [Lachnospiraceae bacterium]|nr:peptidyl-prolyl cis-trans isomerase [Lachnospiraceae bacterium]
MKKTKLSALLLAGTLALGSMAGCGSINGSATVASLGDVSVSLGLFNFAAKYTQAGYDSMSAYFGDDMWSQDLYGSGSTLETDVKNDVLESLENLKLLEAHMADYDYSVSEEETAAIEKAAAEFIEANDKKALDTMGASEEYIKEYLTLKTIEADLSKIIKESADVEVTDEEATQQDITYVKYDTTSYTDTDGNTVEYTDDEKAGFKANAELLVAAGAGSFDTMVVQLGLETSTYTYGSDDDYSTLPEEVITAANALAEGELSDVVETDDAYYVVRKDSTFNAEATEEKKAELLEEKQGAYYDEVLEGFKNGEEWTVNDSEFKKVNFKYMYTEPTTETETETTEVTESAETEAAETETTESAETEAAETEATESAETEVTETETETE